VLYAVPCIDNVARGCGEQMLPMSRVIAAVARPRDGGDPLGQRDVVSVNEPN
jgi:hypothetical protein